LFGDWASAPAAPGLIARSAREPEFAVALGDGAIDAAAFGAEVDEPGAFGAEAVLR